MMVGTVIFLIVLITALIVNSIDSYVSIELTNEQGQLYASDYSNKDHKEKAFQILDHKCNSCHRKRNKTRVFTDENMNSWASNIYKQVFVKKKMPKGKIIKLTSQEYQDLLTWISSTKTVTNGI